MSKIYISKGHKLCFLIVFFFLVFNLKESYAACPDGQTCASSWGTASQDTCANDGACILGGIGNNQCAHWGDTKPCGTYSCTSEAAGCETVSNVCGWGGDNGCTHDNGDTTGCVGDECCYEHCGNPGCCETGGAAPTPTSGPGPTSPPDPTPTSPPGCPNSCSPNTWRGLSCTAGGVTCPGTKSPTCTVGLGATGGTIRTAVSVGVSGGGAGPVRLWVERTNGARLTGSSAPSTLYAAGEYYNSAISFYNYQVGTTCVSSSTGQCTYSRNITLNGPGPYWFHCDVAASTAADACSGFQYCSANGGSYACTWPSCSANDGRSYCANTGSCTPLCGQDNGCVTCASTDTGAPAAPGCSTSGIITSTADPNPVSINWTAGGAKTDFYRLFVDGVGGSTTNTSATRTVTGGSHAYYVLAVNNTCQNIGVGRTYYASSGNCSFCYETNSCTPACGQEGDCSTCANTDTGMGTAATCTTTGTVTPSTISGTGLATMTLDWTAAGTRADYYRIFVDSAAIGQTVLASLTDVNWSTRLYGSHNYYVMAVNNTCQNIGVGRTYLINSATCSFCLETQSCGGLDCGQALDCGSCTTADTGTPGAPTCNNLGTVAANPVNYRWSQETNHALTDYYRYQTDNVNAGTAPATATGVSVNATAGSHTYRVRAVNDTCSNIGSATTYYGVFSSECSYCLETESCGGLNCGQALDCSTCTTADTGAPTAPACSTSGTILSTADPNPVAIRWLAGGSKTDYYRLVVDGVGSTTTNITANRTVNAGDHIYYVLAVNNTCQNIGVGRTDYATTGNCSFCYETQSCGGLNCGQDIDCSTCTTADTGSPGQVSLTAPVGSLANPVDVGVGSTSLRWANNETNHALTDYYRYQVVNLDSGVTAVSGSTVPATSALANYTVGAGTSGQTYEWRVRAENSTCANIGVSSTYAGSWSSWGYFCYEAETCIPACGQSRDCDGNAACASTDATNPAIPLLLTPAGTAVNPVVIEGVNQVTLRWRANTDSYTDFYNYQVINMDTGATVYGVGATVSGIATAQVTLTGAFGSNYQWHVRGGNNSCRTYAPGITYSNFSSWGYYTFNQAPVFDGGDVVVIDPDPESGDMPVAGDGQGRNHICQTEFIDDRRVKFSITVTDGDGGDTIDKVYLSLANGGVGTTIVADDLSGATNVSQSGQLLTIEEAGTAVVGNERNVYFTLEFPLNYPTGIYSVWVYAVDVSGSDTGWVDSLRDYKVWDCQVPVSGGLFDASDSPSISCPTGTGFGTSYPGNDFTSLVFQGAGGAPDASMTVSPPNSYTSGDNLTWGYTYLPDFGGGLLADDPTINDYKYFDVGVGDSGCDNGGGTVTIDENVVDAYSSSPRVRIDFATIRSQSTWYQISGGGMKAGTAIVDDIPVTCPAGEGPNECTPAMSIAESGNDNGLVAAPVITISSSCTTECQYGWPVDSYIRESLISGAYDYEFFYNEYFVKLGEGMTFPGAINFSDLIAGTGGTGIAFVNGNLTINSNNNLAEGDFLMVVVKGNIMINSSVTNLEGVFAADGNLETERQLAANEQLTIEGSVLANGNIRLNRGYQDRDLNNYSPAVKMIYRPDLIFYMPGRLSNIISGWRESP